MIFEIYGRYHEAQMSQNHGQYRWLVSEDVPSVAHSGRESQRIFYHCGQQLKLLAIGYRWLVVRTGIPQPQ